VADECELGAKVAETLDKIEVHTASDLARAARRKLKSGIVADAPADADHALASVRPLPRWMRIAILLGVSIMLWAAIIGGAWWLIAR
jgi:hypothetical protein